MDPRWTSGLDVLFVIMAGVQICLRLDFMPNRSGVACIYYPQWQELDAQIQKQTQNS